MRDTQEIRQKYTGGVQYMSEQQLITKEMQVGDVVKKYPQTADIFMSYGLHCVGCHASYFETLEQGAMGHGMDEETVDKMVEDANEVAKESLRSINKDKENLIIITDKA